MEILKDRLKKCRKDQGLTQAELAKRSYLSKNTISNLERGITRNLKSDEIKLLSYALMVSEDYLTGESNERNKNKDGLIQAISFLPEWHWEIEIKEVLKKHSGNGVIEKILRDCAYMLGQLDTKDPNYFRQTKVKVLQKTIDLLNIDSWKDTELLSDFLDILDKRKIKEEKNNEFK